MLAWIFDECREGQIPRPLGRCKIDTPLLAAGSLIKAAEDEDERSFCERQKTAKEAPAAVMKRKKSIEKARRKDRGMRDGLLESI